MAYSYFGLSAEQINKIRVQSGAKALDFGKTTTSTTNPLTNPPQSAASVTQGVISGLAPNTSGITLNQPTPTASSANTAQQAQPAATKSVYKGEVDAANAAAAAHNASVGGASAGGGSSNPMDSIMSAYNSALSAGSAQSMQNQKDAVAAAFQANLIQNQLNKNLTDLLSASQQQSAASAEMLNKTLATISSGAKGAQTGLEAVDVSEQMAKEDSKRRDLRRTSAAETKKAGLLSQKALLSKPTLLGL